VVGKEREGTGRAPQFLNPGFSFLEICLVYLQEFFDDVADKPDTDDPLTDSDL